MNVENLRKTHPVLVDYLRENGYTKDYINEFLTDIRQVLKEASNQGIDSYEAYYASLGTKFTKSTLHHKLVIIGKIKQFDLKGIFPNPVRHCGFLKQDNYEGLSPEYKKIITVFVKSATNRGVSESYIYRLKLQAANFLLYLQNHGSCSLHEVVEKTVYSYFHDGEKTVKGYGIMQQIKSVLKECIPFYPDGEPERLITFLPGMKKIHKIYPYLEKEELEKIKHTLMEATCTDIKLRNKAILTIAFYTGLRSCDIAALTFENLDWERNRIHLIQNKTAVPLTIPLRPVVGNAILDYIEQERPVSDSETIFLTHDKKPRKLSVSAMYHAVTDVLKKAGVRTTAERKRGVHLFRHHFAVTMLQNGIQTPVISSILGHTSPVSIEPYLESNLACLKECALGIEKYPVGKEVFEV